MDSSSTFHSKRLIDTIIESTPDPGPTEKVVLADCVVTNCDLTKVRGRLHVEDSIFMHCDFSGVELFEPTFKDSTFTNCTFSGASLRLALVANVAMKNCSLAGVDLSFSGFKNFTCDTPAEELADTLFWGVIGLQITLPSCYTYEKKWIPGPRSDHYSTLLPSIGLSREWLRELSATTQIPIETLLTLYNDHPELTPQRFAHMTSIIKPRA